MSRTQRNVVIWCALGAASMIVVGGCARDVESRSGAAQGAGASSPVGDAAQRTAAPAVHPIHAGVTVRAEGTDAVVSYTREKGKPYGVAQMLEPGVLVGCDEVVIAMKTQPGLRPQLCLTDAGGFVWNVAASATGAEAGQLRFDLARVQADPFQNQGRTAPDPFDLASMRMMTLLDITSFMGGAEVACEWRITRIDLHKAGSAHAGGAR